MTFVMNFIKGKYPKVVLQTALIGVGINIIAGVISLLLIGTGGLFIVIPRSLLCWPIAATISLPLMNKHRTYAICTYALAVVLFLVLSMYLDNDALNDASVKAWIILFDFIFVVGSFPIIFILPEVFNGKLKRKYGIKYPPPLPKK